MRKEDKDLLLKDLCSRLPYRVKCERYGKAYELVEIDIKRGLVYVLRNDWYTPTSLPYSIKRNDDIRPYLRPMSSMTEEEKKEYIEYAGYDIEESVNGRHYEFYLKDLCGTSDNPSVNVSGIDWLNSHHFDYRGLIERGLALEAPKDMY